MSKSESHDMIIPETHATLADYMISQRWPAKDPAVIQLYSLPTPNGQKVSIMLEETGLPYEPHRVPFGSEGVMSPEFLSLNPNNKIPAIIDPNGPEGQPFSLFESGAILTYLAEKTEMFFGESTSERYEILQWLMFQMGGVGPMFGQLGFFYSYGGKDIEDKRPLERYINETMRLLNVINQHLANRDWLTEHYSIADIAVGPWLNALKGAYHAEDAVQLGRYKNIQSYLKRFNSREAVIKGSGIPE